ncbi:hypothetical protein L3Q82_007901 [Scortum barcoo]|uniref:Uncharacterized protein n=1 Tax=Scortum barcoo TaxID=214431 RepID=A0ACB8WK91_9TELE|nr:hypothetical protein L3Q82_007901 [Scortum barcoo]
MGNGEMAKFRKSIKIRPTFDPGCPLLLVPLLLLPPEKMSASAIFILDLKGKVLICRNYMGNMDMNEIDHFMPMLMKREEDAEMTPMISHGSSHFLWIKHSNLYFLISVVAMTKKNANAALVYSFLYKIVQVFKEYFKELEEESIRDNFVTVYELMDEVMDFGFPQTTDSKILQEYITQQGHKLEVGAPRPPATVTNAVSWRSEGIKYRKNEVFMDVIESVNLLVSANGSILRSEIVGTIKLKVVLSGMPELRLGLNDKVLFEITGREKSKTVELEDVKFHQCVRLSRFENDRTISFIPPDGESEAYVKPLIWIESVIEKFSHSRVEIKVKARSQFKSRSTANNVSILVPVPSDADSPKFKTSTGSTKWVPEKNVVQWNIKSFPVSVNTGGKEYMMRAHFGLPSVEGEELEAKRPITVNFEIPYFTVSGIQVRYLKIIEKSGYQALPWVRYITQSGESDLPPSSLCSPHLAVMRGYTTCRCYFILTTMTEYIPTPTTAAAPPASKTTPEMYMSLRAWPGFGMWLARARRSRTPPQINSDSPVIKTTRRSDKPPLFSMLIRLSASNAIHVLHGRAEELFEQHTQGQQAEGRSCAQPPFARDAGGGGQEADAAQPAAQD